MPAKFFTQADVGGKLQQTIHSPAVISIGPIADLSPTNVNAGSLVPLGFIDAAVGINPNTETSFLTAATHTHPYHGVITAMGFQVVVSIQHITPWTRALAFGYDVSDNATTTVLTHDGHKLAPLRAVKIAVQGAANLSSTLAVQTHEIEIYKALVVANGEHSFDKGTQTMMPISIFPLANNSDVIGRETWTDAITDPVFE